MCPKRRENYLTGMYSGLSFSVMQAGQTEKKATLEDSGSEPFLPTSDAKERAIFFVLCPIRCVKSKRMITYSRSCMLRTCPELLELNSIRWDQGILPLLLHIQRKN